tara:strand:+ start:1315 stop:2043 length:729 start_codon:yes stop_codon:yes gene_type:complete
MRNNKEQRQMKKIIGVLRVSTDKQRDGYEIQKENLSKLSQGYGIEITDWIEEEAVSGANVKRDGYVKLKEQIVSGEVESVFYSSVTRMGRTLLENVEIIELSRKNDVMIFTYDERIDTRNRGGWLQLELYSVFAKEELYKIQNRIRRTIKKKKAAGVKYNANVMYGLYEKNGVLYEDEFERKIVKNIKNLHSRGWGYHRIAMKLNREGIQTKQRGEKGWSYNQVKRVYDYWYNQETAVGYVS